MHAYIFQNKLVPLNFEAYENLLAPVILVRIELTNILRLNGMESTVLRLPSGTR